MLSQFRSASAGTLTRQFQTQQRAHLQRGIRLRTNRNRGAAAQLMSMLIRRARDSIIAGANFTGKKQ